MRRTSKSPSKHRQSLSQTRWCTRQVGVTQLEQWKNDVKVCTHECGCHTALHGECAAEVTTCMSTTDSQRDFGSPLAEKRCGGPVAITHVENHVETSIVPAGQRSELSTTSVRRRNRRDHNETCILHVIHHTVVCAENTSDLAWCRADRMREGMMLSVAATPISRHRTLIVDEDRQSAGPQKGLFEIERKSRSEKCSWNAERQYVGESFALTRFNRKRRRRRSMDEYFVAQSWSVACPSSWAII
mmetsp:Transcript_6789/g.20687  ORF Transcript_6789/g.20687 Transcript_6789/m.20687 type:complete len:244 (+) Transcript_6789:522-1253(+)